MNINVSELKKLLNEAFEAGFYGCKDIQENVVEELVDQAQQRQLPPLHSTSVTITGSSDGSAAQSPWLSHLAVNPVPNPAANPADRRTWNLPNRNGDIFISPPQFGEIDLNIETVRIEATPDPVIQDMIGHMTMITSDIGVDDEDENSSL